MVNSVTVQGYAVVNGVASGLVLWVVKRREKLPGDETCRARETPSLHVPSGSAGQLQAGLRQLIPALLARVVPRASTHGPPVYPTRP